MFMIRRWERLDDRRGLMRFMCPNCGYVKDIMHMPRMREIMCPRCTEVMLH